MTEWRLIQTKPGAEKRVANGLREHLPKDREEDVYYPVETVWRRVAHRNRKAPHPRPLIRGYVFAALRPSEWPLVHDIEGATRLVSLNGQPARIDPLFIEKLREGEGAGRFDLTRAKGKAKGARRQIGERVRITKGPFDGFVGAVMRLRGARRVEVMLAMLGHQQPVTVSLDLVESEEPEPAPDLSTGKSAAA